VSFWYSFPAGFFWIIVAIIYWFSKDRNRILQQLIRALLATSWIEFSLALPIDLSARNRESCFCVIGSWVTLLVTLPLLIWSVGPALYLLYLRERALSLATPGRAQAILRQKSRRYRQHSRRKAEGYVSSARTLSLLLVALGFVGLQLGMFNYQRSILFSETRDLILVRVLKEQFKDNANLQSHLNQARQQQGTVEEVYTFLHSGLGSIEINSVGSSPSFIAKVGAGEESWKSKPISLDRWDNEQRLDHALTALSVVEETRIAPEKLIRRVQEAIYSRRVKLPSLDFGDFSTDTAAWLVSLLCVAVLVALRNVVHRIFWSADTGIGEAWLVLDARRFAEKIVAGIWIAGMGLSGWLATFGLILTVMDVFQRSSPPPSAPTVGMAFAVFAALVAMSTWAGAATVADLLRLRQQRRLLDGPGQL
jgi:hypothetical protein